MKNILLITMVAGLGLFASACGGAATNNSTANNAATAKAAEKKEEKPAVTLKPGEVPFDGMSNVATTAKAGEIVLTIDESKIAEIAGGAKDPTAIYQNRVMVTPGELESEVEDSFKKKYKVANAYIIAVPKGQKAKVGDVVLTWWQSGGGMMRGYVTDAANPAEPTVRYLGMSPREDKSDKLKPDSFIVVNSEWAPGAPVLSKDANGTEFAYVLRVNGDKVLISGFARKLRVRAKADLTPIPYKPAFKVGDEVKAAFFASFDPATVVAIDPKAGKVTVKRKTGDEQKDLDFGEVTK
ncbi:MAG TPA: hypothetical protein PLL77_01795 [Pyrinomonadaceae bacterium]|nr:hypothetical protein [Pyrinomonadaceae bacterium]